MRECFLCIIVLQFPQTFLKPHGQHDICLPISMWGFLPMHVTFAFILEHTPEDTRHFFTRRDAFYFFLVIPRFFEGRTHTIEFSSLCNLSSGRHQMVFKFLNNLRMIQAL